MTEGKPKSPKNGRNIFWVGFSVQNHSERPAVVQCKSFTKQFLFLIYLDVNQCNPTFAEIYQHIFSHNFFKKNNQMTKYFGSTPKIKIWIDFDQPLPRFSTSKKYLLSQSVSGIQWYDVDMILYTFLLLTSLSTTKFAWVQRMCMIPAVQAVRFSEWLAKVTLVDQPS